MTRAEIASLGRGIPFERTLTKDGCRRDWSVQELQHIKATPGKKYVHNHSKNWHEVLPEYDDFFKFSFLRDPVDIMCSMYFFLLEKPGEPSDPAWGFPASPKGVPCSLNEFVLEYTHNLDTLLPNQEHLDFFRVFSEENLTLLLREHFNAEYEPQRRMNTSSNKGHQTYLDSGELSREAVGLVKETEMYSVYKDLQ